MTSVDDNERTVLHNAVNMEQSNVTTEFLELLLDHNVDVFALDADGRLPLHYAIYKCRYLKIRLNYYLLKSCTTLGYTHGTNGFASHPKDIQHYGYVSCLRTQVS